MQRLEDATLRLMEDGAWTSWLDARARFRKYSPHNSMLILYQKPDASAIASYNQWQEMGYQVRKGEHGIRILAPKTYERRPDRPDLQPQRDGTRPPQGTDSDEKPGLQGIYFVSVSVFDRSQVDPIPGQQHVPLEPPQPALLEGDSHAHLFEPLLEHAAKHGIEVNPHDQDLPEHARGVFRPGAVESSDPKVSLIGKGRPYIGVRADMPPNQKVNTMIHELAHAHKPQDSPFTRAEEEKIAESTSYTVARTAGLQTDGKSIPYIASWSRDRQGAEKLRALAGEIHRRASLIEAALGL